MKRYRSIVFLAVLSLSLRAVAAEEMSQELIDRIRSASLEYHQNLRNYDLMVTEVLHAEKRGVHQKSTRRIVEDSLGQLRVESSIEQYDENGEVIASVETLHIYNLSKEVSSRITSTGEGAGKRFVSIRQRNTLATVLQPKTFFTAGGLPFYELIDELRAGKIPIHGGIVDYDEYPGTLVDLNYEVRDGDGNTLKHTYLINLTGNFFPMRQETYFNGKRFLVLIPTPKEIAPGLFFPIKGMKVSYNVESEENEVSSVTNLQIEKVELNVNMVPGTFTFQFQDGDAITDFRTQPPSKRIYAAPKAETPSEA